MGRRPKKDFVEKVKEFYPLEDRVVIERLDFGTVSEGGLHIPDMAQEERRLARVVAVGEGVWNNGVFVTTTLKPGDYILTTHYKGVDMECKGSKLQILRESDVMARVVPEEEGK